MAGAGGKEVGRVSIRVVPDLDRFREELKRKLEQVERELRGRVNVDVDARLRDSGKKLNKEIQESVKDSKVEVEASAGNTEKLAKDIKKAAKSVKAKTDIELDLERFARRYRNKFQALMSEFEANLPLTVDNEVIREGLVDAEKEFNKKLRLLDPKKDQETLARLRQEVEKFYREARDFGYGDNLLTKEVRSQVKIQFDVANAKREISEIKKKVEDDFAEFKRLDFFNKIGQQRLEVLLRPKIELSTINKIDWDRIGLKQTVAILGSGAFKGASNAFYKLGSAAVSAAKGFWKLGENGMLVVAVLALIAPALALISGLLVAIPAGLAAVAVPIAAVALGIDGIKKAAEASKVEFEALKQVMNDRWATNLTPVFEQLNQLGPVLQRSMPKVADGLTAMAQGFTDAVTSAPGMAAIENTINNIGEALGRSKQGVTDFTNGLLNLVSALSDKFPGLADAFNRTGQSFLEWVDKITTKGPDGVSQLDTAMNQLGDTLSRLGGLVTTFFQSGWENLSNVDFGKSMSGFVESVDRLVNVTLPALAGAFEQIATALRPIVVLVETIDRILSGLKAKLPSSDDITSGLFGGGSANKVLFGDLLGGLVDKLTGAEVSSKTQAAGEKAGSGFVEGFGKSSATVTQKAKEMLNQSLTVGGVASGATGGAITGVINTQITQAMTAAETQIQGLGTKLTGALDQAMLPLKDLPVKIGTALGLIAPSIEGAFTVVAQAAQNAALKVGDAIAGTLTREVPAAVNRAMGAVAGAVSAGLAPAAGAALNGASQIVNAILQGLTPVLAAVTQIFSGVPGVIQAAMAPAIAVVGSVGQQIVSTMLSFTGAAQSAGQAIGASFAAGISSQTGTVQSAASALMAAARAFFPQSPAEKGPFSGKGWVTYSGQSIGDGFASGLRDSTSGVVNTAKELMQAIKDVFGSAEGVNFNFIFGGAESGLTASGRGIAGVSTEMASISTSAQTFRQSMEGAATALQPLSSGEIKAQLDELGQQLLDLEIQRKTLMQQKYAGGADKEALKSQLAQIAARKNALGLQRDQLNYQLKYGGAVNDTTKGYQDQLKSLSKMPFDFATATSNQFMSDLGWSGQGMIPSLLQQGLDYGSQFIFNVSNMDDALSGQRTLQNRQMQATLGR